MKKKEIKSVIEGLKKVKLPKLDDKNLSTALFKIFMKLCGEQRKYEQEVKDAQEAFLAVHEEEQKEVSKLLSELNAESDPARRRTLAKEIDSHVDYREAVDESNKQIEALGNEEVEVDTIDAEKFQEQYQKQDYELSVIEQIYPLFK